MRGLEGILGGGVVFECGVGGYVVPGVVFVDIVRGAEVAGAEFERVCAFEAGERVVGAVGWSFCFCFRSCLCSCLCFLMRFWGGEGECREVRRIIVVWKRHLYLDYFNKVCK